MRRAVSASCRDLFFFISMRKAMKDAPIANTPETSQMGHLAISCSMGMPALPAVMPTAPWITGSKDIIKP